MIDATALEGLSQGEILTLMTSVQREIVEREAFTLVAAADWADRHCPDSADEQLLRRDAQGRVIPGSERSRLYGGEGTPLVREFSPSEFGLPLQLSPWQASRLVADALDLRHRLPKLWRRVLAGEVPAWKARKVAAATRHLSKEAAGLVDNAICDVITRENWSRFSSILSGKIIAADPDAAQSRADDAARARYVSTGRSTELGMKSIHGRAPTADVLRLKAQVDRLAKILAAHGDLEDADARRSKALMLLADPVLSAALLASSEGMDLSKFDLEDDDEDGMEGVPGDGHYHPTGTYRSPDHDQEQSEPPSDSDIEPDPGGSPAPGGRSRDPATGQRGTVSRERRDGHAASAATERSRRTHLGSGDWSAPSSTTPLEETGPRADPGPETDSAASARDLSEETGRPADPGPGENGPGENGPGENGPGENTVPATMPPDGTGPPEDPGPGENSAQNGAPAPGHELRAGLRRMASAAAARAMLNTLAECGIDPARIGPRYTVYVHFAGETVRDGNGVVRLEGAGSETLEQLRRFLGPNAQIRVKPVVDLDADQTPVDAYEIPVALRELLRLRQPGDMTPWSSQAGPHLQIDHTIAFKHRGSRGLGQTRLINLDRLGIFNHRNKTFGGMIPRQPQAGRLLWRSPTGYVSLTDHTGTHNLGRDTFAQAVWRAAVQMNAELVDAPPVVVDTEDNDPDRDPRDNVQPLTPLIMFEHPLDDEPDAGRETDGDFEAGMEAFGDDYPWPPEHPAA